MGHVEVLLDLAALAITKQLDDGFESMSLWSDRTDLGKINREQCRSPWGASHLLLPLSSGHLPISSDNCGWRFWEVKTHMLCCSVLWYGLSPAAAHHGFGPGDVDFPLTLPACSPFVSNVFGELPWCSSQDLPAYKKCTMWATAGWSYGPSSPTPVIIMFLAVGVSRVIASPSAVTGGTFEGINRQNCWV